MYLKEFYERKEASIKILGDLFESILGALFIDNLLDLNKTTSIILNFY